MTEPTTPAEALAEGITRWMMGEGFVAVHRWMTTGWRDTMYDEGVALWTPVILAALPPGSALVTAETLAAALQQVPVGFLSWWLTRDGTAEPAAAALIEALRRDEAQSE